MYIKTKKHFINFDHVTYVMHRMEQPGLERLVIHFKEPVPRFATDGTLDLRRQDAIAVWDAINGLRDIVSLTESNQIAGDN